ncbi:MAG TPA: GNAT family N-acetyltransferase [Herpetosiphonaceae bacterium]|nr:GNAT family N-acetyltransferase [Herpetosiphonaceae bacterium]
MVAEPIGSAVRARRASHRRRSATRRDRAGDGSRSGRAARRRAVAGGLRIRRARTPDEVKDFAEILAANWAPPDPDVLRFYELAAPALLAEGAPLWLYVGYLGEVPVATAELTVGGAVVGLYNISTLAAYRRRGFGTALTVQPLLDARAQGYRTAILQAQGSDGVRVYARLGFEPFGEITEYKPASSAAGGDV